MDKSLFRKKSIAQIQADAAAGFSDAENASGDNTTLRRSLGTFDLTMLGIAAIVGAGIFALVGEASNKGGPGVVLLFIFASIACGFAALCYAEFASMIPIDGERTQHTNFARGEAALPNLEPGQVVEARVVENETFRCSHASFHDAISQRSQLTRRKTGVAARPKHQLVDGTTVENRGASHFGRVAMLTAQPRQHRTGNVDLLCRCGCSGDVGVDLDNRAGTFKNNERGLRFRRGELQRSHHRGAKFLGGPRARRSLRRRHGRARVTRCRNTQRCRRQRGGRRW